MGTNRRRRKNVPLSLSLSLSFCTIVHLCVNLDDLSARLVRRLSPGGGGAAADSLAQLTRNGVKLSLCLGHTVFSLRSQSLSSKSPSFKLHNKRLLHCSTSCRLISAGQCFARNSGSLSSRRLSGHKPVDHRKGRADTSKPCSWLLLVLAAVRQLALRLIWTRPRRRRRRPMCDQMQAHTGGCQWCS